MINEMIDVRKVTRAPYIRHVIIRIPLEFADKVGIKDRVIIRIEDGRRIVLEPA